LQRVGLHEKKGETDKANTTEAPYGRKTQREPAVKEVHVLWSPDGLGCDGDTISTTAATQPSIEDIVMGAIPGLPKVHLHNRVLDYSLGGEEYLKPWFAAAEDRLDAPFVLVIEGSIPNEEIKMDEPPGGMLSSALVSMYGRVVRNLRGITNSTVNKEPKWRHRGRELTTGYHPTSYGNGGVRSQGSGVRDPIRPIGPIRPMKPLPLTPAQKKRDFGGKYIWVMSPRWYDKRKGHRHHAGRPQLRPVPAVRRPHVPRRRQAARCQARADVRRARVICRLRAGRLRLSGGRRHKTMTTTLWSSASGKHSKA
jgi:hypothetical protein